LSLWGEAVKRREFVALVGSSAVAQLVRPSVARAQETGRSYRLGIIFSGSREAPRVVAFFDELKSYSASVRVRT